MKHFKIITISLMITLFLLCIGALVCAFLYGFAQSVQMTDNPAARNGEKISMIIAWISGISFVLVGFIAFVSKSRHKTIK